MLLKERLGATDEETVAQVFENPYLQLFLGYPELLKNPPFDPSMMVYFRSRFAQGDYDEVNVEIIRLATAPSTPSTPDEQGEDVTDDPAAPDQATPKVASESESERHPCASHLSSRGRQFYCRIYLEIPEKVRFVKSNC